MKKTGAALILALFLALPGTTRGATEGCALARPIADLKSVRKAPAADQFEAIRAELKVRKDALREVIPCLVREAQSLRERVHSLSLEDEQLRRLQERFVERLDDAKKFYENHLKRVDDLGIRGSQDMARTLKEWRASTFGSLQDESVAFVLWVKNQELLRAARTRFEEVSRAMKLLNLTENEDIAALFEAARAELEATESLNAEAGRVLLDSGPSRESLTRIKATLASLQDTYKAFFELSEAVEKILPR